MCTRSLMLYFFYHHDNLSFSMMRLLKVLPYLLGLNRHHLFIDLFDAFADIIFRNFWFLKYVCFVKIIFLERVLTWMKNEQMMKPKLRLTYWSFIFTLMDNRFKILKYKWGYCIDAFSYIFIALIHSLQPQNYNCIWTDKSNIKPVYRV